jgi:hypothetical protein
VPGQTAIPQNMRSAAISAATDFDLPTESHRAVVALRLEQLPVVIRESTITISSRRPIVPAGGHDRGGRAEARPPLSLVSPSRSPWCSGDAPQ